MRNQARGYWRILTSVSGYGSGSAGRRGLGLGCTLPGIRSRGRAEKSGWPVCQGGAASFPSPTHCSLASRIRPILAHQKDPGNLMALFVAQMNPGTARQTEMDTLQRLGLEPRVHSFRVARRSHQPWPFGGRWILGTPCSAAVVPDPTGSRHAMQTIRPALPTTRCSMARA
jgi:hypothetical protein